MRSRIRIKKQNNFKLIFLQDISSFGEDFFFKNLIMSPFDRDEFNAITNSHRKLQWLAARYALQKLSLQYHLDYKGLYKNEDGRPFLWQQQGFISLSHSKDAVLAALAVDRKIGVDIEYFREDIARFSHKFMSDYERQVYTNVEQLVLIWSVKESIYKIYESKCDIKDIIIQKISKNIVFAVARERKFHTRYCIHGNRYITISFED